MSVDFAVFLGTVYSLHRSDHSDRYDLALSFVSWKEILSSTRMHFLSFRSDRQWRVVVWWSYFLCDDYPDCLYIHIWLLFFSSRGIRWKHRRVLIMLVIPAWEILNCLRVHNYSPRSNRKNKSPYSVCLIRKISSWLFIFIQIGFTCR